MMYAVSASIAKKSNLFQTNSSRKSENVALEEKMIEAWNVTSQDYNTFLDWFL
jgi:hypothetical protein